MKNKEILWLNNDFKSTIFGNLVNASEATGLSKLDIMVAITSNGKTDIGFFIKKSREKAKYIAQIDKNTEKIIGIYHGLSNAVYNTGISTIKRCLDGKIETAGGYYWQYINIKDLHKAKFTYLEDAQKTTIIIYYDDITDDVLYYRTILEAAIKTGLTENEIRDAIKHNSKTSIGFFAKLNSQHTTIPVLQIDMNNMSVINLYSSVYDAKMKTGICNIARCARGKAKSAGGYYWQFI